MPASKNLGAYTDCHSVFESALANDGARVEFETPGKARNFSQRCYSYRKLLHEKQAAGLPTGAPTTTPYDGLKIRLDGKFLNFEPHTAKGLKVTTLDGEPVDVEGPVNYAPQTIDPETRQESSDELLEEAFDIAEEIRKSGAIDIE